MPLKSKKNTNLSEIVKLQFEFTSYDSYSDSGVLPVTIDSI